MSVKRFVAADMRRALELVRQEMGPDAVILSSRRIKQGVEILTSMEPPASNPKQPAPVDMPVEGVDVPMGSDASWKDQVIAEQAMASNADRILGADTSDFNISPAVPASPAFAAPQEQAGSRGLASGKTSQELAAEIDAARNRMLAAKKAQSALEQPVGYSSPGHSTLESPEEMQDYAPNPQVSAVAEQPVREPVERFERAERVERAVPDLGVSRMDARRERDLVVREQQAQQQQEKLDALQSELADMRLLLEEQLTKIAKAPKFESPLQSGVMRRLQQMGITDELCQNLVANRSLGESMQEAWSETLALLARQLPADASDPVMQGGVFALVGPTGAGKTTTLAKLAARYVLENGAENVTLVTTDTYRLAAQEQLRSLGRILGVQVKVVDDNNDLPSVLRSLKHCPLVLIDTAGFRNGDTMLRDQLQVIQEIPGVNTLLVMASNSQYQTMKATVHAHKPNRLAGCILTKLDETVSLGEALSVVLEHRLSCFYTTDGQEIPQDLHMAKGHQLVSRSVALLKHSQVFAQGVS